MKSSRKKLFSAFFGNSNPQFWPNPLFFFFRRIMKNEKIVFSWIYHEKSLLKPLKIAIFALIIIYFWYEKAPLWNIHKTKVKKVFTDIDRKFSVLKRTFLFIWKVIRFDSLWGKVGAKLGPMLSKKHKNWQYQ